MPENRMMSWLKLVRLPNLFTVPGDSLLGYALVGGIFPGAEAFLAVSVSMLIYVCGLITNDIADIAEDRKTRPERPLASGRVPVTHAWTAAIICAVSALSLAFWHGKGDFIVLTLVLIGMVFAYNFWLKNSKPVGAFMLGFCRVFNVMLGTAVLSYGRGANEFLLISLLSAMCLYIYGLSLAASVETDPGEKPLIAPLVAVAAATVCWPFAALMSLFNVMLLLNDVPPAILWGIIFCLAQICVVFPVMYRWAKGSALGGVDRDVGYW